MLRLAHVETLLLLCTTRWGREFLRGSGTYEIVRAAHESEQVERVSVSAVPRCDADPAQISDHIERLVNLLKRDEEDERIAEV